MARHGDGLYLRGQTWYLDCRSTGPCKHRRIGCAVLRQRLKGSRR
jgi:hypothetical protein